MPLKNPAAALPVCLLSVLISKGCKKDDNKTGADFFETPKVLTKAKVEYGVMASFMK